MGTSLAVIETELRSRLPIFADVLPRDLPPERLMRTVLVSCERTPRLLDCSQQSIMNSALTAAVLALEVDGVTGQGFLVPYRDVATFQIGYKGYPTIAARSGMSIQSGVYREGDQFEFERGTAGFVRHKPLLSGRHNRKIIAAWAAGTAIGRPPIFEVIAYDDVLAIRDRSPGAKKADSPWNDHNGPGHEAMVAKTAVRRLGRSVPIVAFQRAVALEDQQDMGRAAWLRPDGALIIDASAYPERQPEPAGAIAAPPQARWQMPDGSMKTWPSIGAMIGALLPRVTEAGQAEAKAAHERNRALMAEMAQTWPSEMLELARALEERASQEAPV